MKYKNLKGIILFSVLLAGCGGFSAYKWAVDSVFASHGLVVRLDVADENQFYRIQTDESGVHAATINKSGDIVEEQSFVTEWKNWHKIVSANPGQYFIYSDFAHMYPSEPLHIAFVDVEARVMNENFDLSALLDGYRFRLEGVTVTQKNELVLVGNKYDATYVNPSKSLIVVVDSAGTVVYTHTDPEVGLFFNATSLKNGDFAVYGSPSLESGANVGRVFRFNPDHQLITQIALVEPDDHTGHVRAITDKGTYFGIHAPNADTVNLKLIDWQENEKFSADVDDEYFFYLFDNGYFHEFDNGSFVLGNRDVIEKFDAMGRSVFRYVPAKLVEGHRVIAVGPHDDLFVGYETKRMSAAPLIATGTDAAGNPTTKIVLSFSGATNVGYQQIATDGTLVRKTQEQPFKFTAEIDQVAWEGTFPSYSATVKSVSPGPCKLAGAVVMPDGMLISHSQLCDETAVTGGLNSQTPNYTTRAY
ncbi:MAG TPA: hypothetical protein VFX11_17005 [Candidatus Kapabacteria bacterium]|nr:hypothetical protein [Candidatus Kapabacteria bacterium]